MADRNVLVRLRADVSSYAAGMAKAAAATKALGSEIDTTNDRTAWLAQGLLAIGPALVPIGASAVPVIAGLTTQLGLAVGAAGITVLAFQGVGDSLKALNAYQLEPTAENLAKLNEQFAKIGPDGASFVEFLDDVAPKFNELQDAARAGLFPGIERGITSLIGLLPQLKSIFTEVSTAVGDLMADTGAGLAGAGFADFFDYLESDARPLLMEMGHTIGNFTEGIAAMLTAFAPLTDSFSGGFLEMSDSFAQWAHGLEDSDSFDKFVAYVQEAGPRVLDMIGSLADMFVELAAAAAPIGDATVEVITALADAIGALASTPLGPIALGLAAIASAYGRLKALGSITTGGMLGGTAFASTMRGVKDLGVTAGDVSTKMQYLGQSSKYASDQTMAARASVAKLRPALMQGAAAGALLALTMTDIDEKVGLTNTAMGAAAGMMVGGPWGAALGAAVGFATDAATANNAFTDSVKQVEAALSSGGIASITGSLENARAEYAALAEDLDKNDLLNGLDPGFYKSSIEGFFGDNDVEDAAKDMAVLEESVRNAQDSVGGLADAMGMSVGPIDGSAASARELDAVLAAAGPKMDELRYTQEDLALAYKVSTGEANAFEIAMAAGKPTYDQMLAAITAGDDATNNFSESLGAAARAAALEASALEEATKATREKTAAALAGFDAETRYRQALKDATEQAKKNDAGIRGSSKAALANRTALGQLAGAWNNQSDAVKNNVARFKDSRKAFIDTAVAMGVPEQAAKDLAARLLDIPTSVVSKIELRGAPEAIALAARVKAGIESIKDRTVYLTTVSRNVGGRPMGGQAPGSAADGGTVPKTGLPYADRHLYLLADGEEVISNRRGEADRYRAAKGIPPARRLAEGGTAGGRASIGDPIGFRLFDPMTAAAAAAQEALGNLAYAGDEAAESTKRERNERRKAAEKELEQRRKLIAKELEHADKKMQAELDGLKKLKDAQQSLADAVSSNFRSSLFGDSDLSQQYKDGNLDSRFGQGLLAFAQEQGRQTAIDAAEQAVKDARFGTSDERAVAAAALAAAQASPGFMTGVLTDYLDDYISSLTPAQVQAFQGQATVGTLQQDASDATKFQQALEALTALGLDGGLFQELATSGNLGAAQYYATLGAGDISNLEQQYDIRNQAANSVGSYAGDVEFRAAIREQTKVFRDARDIARETKATLHLVEQRQARMEKRQEHMEKLAETNPQDTGRAVGVVFNGVAASAQRSNK